MCYCKIIMTAQHTRCRDFFANAQVPNMNPDGSWRGHLRTNAVRAHPDHA